MSDRDPVRELAEEIADAIVEAVRSAIEGEGGDVHAVPMIESRIRAFLAEREAETAKKLRAGAGDVVEIFIDARPPGTVDLVYDKLARSLGLPEDCHGE